MTTFGMSKSGFAVALALVVRIHRAYGTVEEVEILAADEDEADEPTGDAGA